MADENYTDIYYDSENDKEGIEIHGKDAVLLNAPEVLLSPDTPLLTKAQDIAGAINELFQSGGEGGDEEWTFPESWGNIPEPKAKQIVILIEIFNTDINNPSLAFRPDNDTSTHIGEYVDWGDGYRDEFKDRYYMFYTHLYKEAGLYTITINCPTSTKIDIDPTCSTQVWASGDVLPTPSGQYINISSSTTMLNKRIRAIKSGSDIIIRTNLSGNNFAGLVYFKFCGNSYETIYNYYHNYNMFGNCYSLCKIDFEVEPSELTNGFCYNCYSLKSADFLNSVTELPSIAFEYCHSLKEIELSSVITADPLAFYGCANLKKLNAPMLTDFQSSFLGNCYNLEEIYTPMLAEVASNALLNCYSLRKFTYAESCNFNGNTFENCNNLYPKPK